MENVCEEVAAQVWQAASLNLHKRLLVGIAGPPGSGKTTVANAIAKILNAKASSTNSSTAVVFSIDGFHYTRSKLDTFPDAAEAHKRRGAPWTFDVDAIVGMIQRLHDSTLVSQSERIDMFAPSFDHSVKDPVNDDIKIAHDASIVILEGNYLLLDEGRWKDISPLLDFRIFVHVEDNVARQRIVQRHLLSGIEHTFDLAGKRFDDNDGINGELVRRRALPSDLRVTSMAW